MDFAYPRPQLVRRQWTCLNGPWRFRYDDERRYSSPRDIDAWPMQITVPFAPESVASGIGDTGFHVACWYEREFDCMPAEDRVIPRFGAVDYAAQLVMVGPAVKISADELPRLENIHWLGQQPYGLLAQLVATWDV